MKLSTTLAGALALGACGLSASTFAAQCEVDRTINFGGMTWESNLILTDVERFIMEKGYGCKTQVQPGEVQPIYAAAQRGDVDVIAEVWSNSSKAAWQKAVDSGKVKAVGQAYVGGEGWFIPRYTAERLPELKSPADLPRFKDAFADPEEPGKGRFYGCPAGWGCEVTSRNLFNAFKLGDSFSLYSPGTGAAQKAALMSAYRRKQDVVFYYWYPTPVVGGMDLVKLDMPPYDEAAHTCNTNADCSEPQPSGYPDAPVLTGVNTDFAAAAPQLAAFLGKVKVPEDDLGALLAWFDEEGVETDEAARHFLAEYPDAWADWVPAEVAERVRQAL